MIYDFLKFLYYFSESLYKSTTDIKNGVDGVRISCGGVFSLSGGYLSYVLLVFLAYYACRSIGLYKMAKKRGFDNPIKCLIPFYAIFMISKLRSECNAFKKHGFFPIVAVSAIGVSVLTSAIVDICFVPNVLKQLLEFENSNPGNAYLTAQMFASGNDGLATTLMNISELAKICYIVFTAMIYCDLFRTYSPFKGRTHTVLSVIFVAITGSMLLFGIFTLVLSGQNAINYDEVLEKRRVYYGYGNPYGPANGRGMNGTDNRNRNDDPFSDFSNGNGKADDYGNAQRKDDDPFGEFGGNSQNDPFSDFTYKSPDPQSGNGGKTSDNDKSDDNNNNHDDGDSLF